MSGELDMWKVLHIASLENQIVGMIILIMDFIPHMFGQKHWSDHITTTERFINTA